MIKLSGSVVQTWDLHKIQHYGLLYYANPSLHSAVHGMTIGIPSTLALNNDSFIQPTKLPNPAT